MAKIIGVRFRNTGKTYYFDPDGNDITPGSGVIVETAQGVEFGNVTIGTKEVPEEEVVAPLKKIIREATKNDLRQLEVNRAKEERALAVATEKAEKYKLDMKMIRVEYTFDGAKAVFYFTSEGRVDFRELVKDLAGTFHTRIELRQIGVRDETKLLGGLGPCGLPCCCNAFLGGFQPVSIKMAKEQGLSLNPTKISGLCGRLMCCLKYEQSTYEQAHRKMPSLGAEAKTVDGEGKITEVNVLKETVKVTLRMPGDQIEVREYPYTEVSVTGAPRRGCPRKEAAEETAQSTAAEVSTDRKDQHTDRPRNDRKNDGRQNGQKQNKAEQKGGPSNGQGGHRNEHRNRQEKRQEDKPAKDSHDNKPTILPGEKIRKFQQADSKEEEK